jgi:selenocysteine-specific elongation factor
MDKNPQSRERGITIDLGFSSFTLPSETTQVTLVDCPGHASLIRTVLAGAQIIDMCLLVLDAQKGFQTQTVESVVIAEIVTSRLIVVVNKIDLIPNDAMETFVSKMEEGIRRAMGKTCFSSAVPIVFISATQKHGIDGLIRAFQHELLRPPSRDSAGVFHFAYDHCFSLKGHGTVFTGTVLSGTVRRGQTVTLLDSNEVGEVRSIQRFRSPVENASQGDRVGLCIPGISPVGKERGDIFEKNPPLRSASILLAAIYKIRQFKDSLDHSRVHLTIGHAQCMATPLFLKFNGSEALKHKKKLENSFPSNDSGFLGKGILSTKLDEQYDIVGNLLRQCSTELSIMEDATNHSTEEPLLCLLLLDRPVKYVTQALFVASRLDLNEKQRGCRVPFFGRILDIEINALKSKVVREKFREGKIDRILDHFYCLVGGLMHKAADISGIIGLSLSEPLSGLTGKIESKFGKSGLVRVRFEESLSASLVGRSVILRFKKEAISNLIENHLS